MIIIKIGFNHALSELTKYQLKIIIRTIYYKKLNKKFISIIFSYINLRHLRRYLQKISIVIINKHIMIMLIMIITILSKAISRRLFL